MNLAIFTLFFPSFLMIENLQNYFLLNLLNLNFWKDFANKKDVLEKKIVFFKFVCYYKCCLQLL
jgi:hypothetical protein